MTTIANSAWRMLLPCCFLVIGQSPFAQQTSILPVFADQTKPIAPVVIEANLPKTIYGHNDPINVRVTVHNESEQVVTIASDPTNTEDGLSLVRTDSKKIGLTHPISEDSFGSQDSFGNAKRSGVKPHSQMTFLIRLREWFVIDQPGQYYLQYRTKLRNTSINVESNLVSFQVE